MPLCVRKKLLVLAWFLCLERYPGLEFSLPIFLFQMHNKEITSFLQAFFITNLEPVKFSEFVSLILEDLGYQR